MPGEREQTRMRHKHIFIFIVNGSPLFLDLMRMFPHKERLNVTTTNFVPRTFEQISALQPDLLVIDLTVGHDAGWELLSRPRSDAMTSGVPVIVVSTPTGLLEPAEAEPERHGGQRFINKRFNLDDILDGNREPIGDAQVLSITL
ncbi:MAG TPA: response regulator [Thermomicrobiales bacterium]|nr:response regulator [Thermomicrobiales bacterium]